MEIKETVLEINNVRGRPLQRTAKLSNEKSIAVPFEFISSIQIGDSILKYKNSNKYTLKSKNKLKSITTKN